MNYKNTNEDTTPWEETSISEHKIYQPLEDYSELLELIGNLRSCTESYIQDPSDMLASNLIAILENLFEILSNFDMPFPEIAVENEFYYTILDLLTSSPDINVLYNAFICFGISLERYPEIIQYSFFNSLLSQVLNEMDEHFSILISPGTKILCLGITHFNDIDIDMLTRIIEQMPLCEQHTMLVQLVQKLGSIWYNENDPDYLIKLNQYLNLLEILISEKKILTPTVQLLKELFVLAKNRSHRIQIQHSVIHTNSVKIIFTFIEEIEEKFRFDILSLIEKILRNKCGYIGIGVFFTYIKSHIQFYFDLTEEENPEEIQIQANKILCHYFMYVEENPNFQVEEWLVVKMYDLINHSNFKVKKDAVRTLSQLTRRLTEEQVEYVIDQGILDFFLDMYDSESEDIQMSILSGFRRLTSNGSKHVAEAIMELEEFFAEAELESEAKASLCYLIHTIVVNKLQEE
ncbi:hypothetical protein TVAG_447170 [Trichomonas vaginalis G3]|uniref:Uncharacterized protein n=1 Tax=Trichomonas vaginalis (strain ATCC PRA-98 / G3) TaxID=412133 RepID=A2DRY9_TRIV3|nr:importin alpha family [Trichomonas vaginalis G3]EAY16759.1 hypothetical protein TVAG_447170 [Trichomonas vaginalis G3]KAI5490834.1 importin alpha family [Trichomonas vaginalis G3]|eukprot:XP_001328982.1 hypothetical protein [Trichomonas vaginalis G3]